MKGKHIILSVVVPTHGRVDLFFETLQSLQMQSIDHFELIVTDDSVNESERVLIKDACYDFQKGTGHTLNYIFSKVRLGQAKNTNQGLRAAQGKYIRILHSDDLLAPKALEAEVALMENESLNMEMLFHNVEAFKIAPHFDKQPTLSFVQPSLLFRLSMHSNTPLPSAIFFSREIYERIGGMREDLDFLCDWDFCARIVVDQDKRQRFIGNVSQGFVGWRVHGDSTTGKLWHRHFLEHELFMSELENNSQLISKMIGQAKACDRFFSLAARYRYNRLFRDISKMSLSYALKSFPTILRCFFSNKSLCDRLKPAPWSLIGRLRYPKVSMQRRGEDLDPIQRPSNLNSSFFSVIKSYLAEKIIESSNDFLFHKGKLAKADVKHTMSADAGPDLVALGNCIDIRTGINVLQRTPDTIHILSEFNNLTNFWPLRKLISESRNVKISAINRNNFFEPALAQCLKYVQVGTEVKVKINDNKFLTFFGFKALIDKLFPQQFLWVGQTPISPTLHEIHYQRSTPAHAAFTSPHSGWTFGMLTTGTRLENVEKFIDSIEKYCQEPHEIILISPVGLGELENRKNVHVINFAENDELGWITRKKNIICEHASYSDILICHDRFWLSESFTHDFENWGYSYGLASPQITLEDGRRAVDWGVVSSENLVWSFGGLLDYRAYSQYSYNPGGATIIRKEFWKDFQWNENLFWNEHEDVELCRRIQRSGFLISYTPAKLITGADRWVDENKLIPYCETNEVLFGHPVGEQRIFFIEKDK